MQPTAPQSTGGGPDMDLPTVQSMDWVFQNKQLYFLAQYLAQQAEKKEKLSTTAASMDGLLNAAAGTTTTATANATSPLMSAVLEQNGVTPPSPSTTPLSEAGSTSGKLLMDSSPDKPASLDGDARLDLLREVKALTINNNNNSSSNNNNKSSSDSCSRVSPSPDKDESGLDGSEQASSNDKGSSNVHCNASNANESTNSTSNNSSSSSSNVEAKEGDSKETESRTTRTLAEELSAKNREVCIVNSMANVKVNNNNNNNNSSGSDDDDDCKISALFEEVARLRTAIANIQESHNVQIQRLEDRLEEKRQHIVRLESRIEKQQDFDDLKKENNILRSVDLSTSHDSKQFQELLLERTKALAAQTEAIKSSNSEGSPSSGQPKPASSPAATSSCSTATTTIPTHAANACNASNDLLPVNNSSGSSSNGNAVSTSSISISTPAAISTTAASNNNNINSISNSFVSSRRPSVTPSPSAIGPLVGPPAHVISGSNSLAQLSSFLPPPLQNVEQFGSFLDLIHHEQDKASSHHDNNSSSASTPILQESSRHDELMNGGGLTPMRMSKSPLEDNNNTLLPLPNTGPSLIQGLPFQFQERGHFRFAEDLQLPPGAMVGRLGDSLIPKGDPMEAKLQEMLRYNMDKYANQNLDTLHISRRVRELLSVHNIGQRLFAKYVLGLSQGTVSELLSKPKPWDKLTEKGRDSYRKMHAWACDENAVLLLKSLIPKKGKEPGMPSFGRPEGSDMNDDRIQHILSEAQSMIKRDPPPGPHHPHPHPQLHQQLQLQQQLQLNSLDDSQHSDNDSKSPHSRDVQSPFAKDYLNRRAAMKKFSDNNDDIPQDKIAKIYQEEFSKLIRSPREFPNFLFPHFLGGGMPPMERPAQDDNIRMALEAYHRELAKLQQNAAAGAGIPSMPNISNLPNFLALHQQHQQQQQQQQQQAAAQQQQPPHHPTGLNGSVQDLSLPKEKQMAAAGGKLNGSMTDLESEIDAANKEVDDAMKHSAFSMVKPKPEPGTCTPTTTASSAPSPISNSILPPVIAPSEEFSVSASPLQRMASITNSLITQPPVTPHHSSQQRPLKAILPPITQQQFDLYNSLNTEDIVRRVKESLSQYSISQRLFGESVLGLSQGSVSDLLARPKPWHMLTQKGREPFIRMKMFLEDDNAVHKLVASQYKIAPEKLMRTGNYSGTPQIPGMMVKNMPPMPKMLSDSINKLQQDQKTLLQLQMSQMQQMPPTSQAQQMQQHQQQLHQQQLAAAAAAQHQAQQEAAAAAAAAAVRQPPSSQPSPVPSQTSQSSRQQPSPQTMLLTPPGIPPQHAITLQTPHGGGGGAPSDKKSSSIMMGIHSPQQQQQQHTPPSSGQPGPPPGVNSMRGALHQHISPTVYEMAALTQDLDTQVITTKIKEALLANNIGQKIFGEAVLGLSQGSVSELLSKPKPWHMLSIKGREPFIRMQLWLSDSNNVERLQMLKNERREASKRRRSTGPGAQDNSSDTSSNDTSEFYHSNSPGPGSVGSAAAPPNKKQRVLFSEEQKEALRLAFALDPYPNVQTIEFLATELGLSTRTITNWFHNHRMRLKQQVPHGQPSEPIPSRENQTGAPFDPVQFRVLLSQRLMEIQKERLGLSGVPLPYPPYFAANPNLAALIGRGFIPGDVDLAALNKAVSEQMSGLDLSMPSSVKREGEEDYEEDGDHDGESHVSDSESMNDNRGGDGTDDQHSVSGLSLASLHAMSRISRRKPAAPQWVNPDWQADDKKSNIPGGEKKDAADIINGVCVLQPDNVPSVQQRFVAAMAAAAAAVAAAASGSDHDDQDDARSTHSRQSGEEQREAGEEEGRAEKDASESAAAAATTVENSGDNSEKEVQVKTELMEEGGGERWEY
ncbi:homeobox protein cut isoform X4 [Culex pipiens pallens]|uniref:homeobox protein cut isoform X4 n=1 Tax=Culex pipiens pallens TaxID=42434 RepID=UPI0022AA188A|nr:homeobox protein cut isoform X4 [Culex pipiens pallens]